MKRIGIITIHSDLNYGAALQAYALNTFLRNRNYQCEIINYIKIPNHPPHFPFPINIAYWIMNLPRFYRYRKFLKGSVSKKTYKTIDSLMTGFNGQYDIIISGSDQVWNPTCGGLINKLNPIYYLAFADQNIYKKISYASSIGSYIFNEEEKIKVKKWLEEYKHLSTRELSGAKILESFINKKIEVVIDPTLLLSAKEWHKISHKININYKYVLVYYIDEIDEVVSYARKIANKHKWKVIMMSNKKNPHPGVDINIRFCGPSEFIYLFENAEYICTNSFHGTAFSVNFNKNFISIIKRNSPQRAQNLLASLGLSDRLLTNIDDLDSTPENIDFSDANNRLEILRKKSIDYLINAIEN